MKSARITLLLLSIGFLLTETLVNYVILTLGGGDLFTTIIKILLFLLFILLFSKKVNWAKWVLSIALILYGIFYLLAGVELGYIFFIIGLYNIFFGIYLLKSKALAFYRIYGTDEDLLIDKNPLAEIDAKDNIKHNYPRLVRRYKALFIDGIIILTTLIAIMLLVQDSETRVTIMVSSGLIILISYEPILTAYSKTIGQRLMKIRVSRHDNPKERITLVNAYIRWIAKGLLGWLSFITIIFNTEKRAIHDIASDSVMIMED